MIYDCHVSYRDTQQVSIHGEYSLSDYDILLPTVFELFTDVPKCFLVSE